MTTNHSKNECHEQGEDTDELPDPSVEILETGVLAVGNKAVYLKAGVSLGAFCPRGRWRCLEIVWLSQLKGGLLMASSG